MKGSPISDQVFKLQRIPTKYIETINTGIKKPVTAKIMPQKPIIIYCPLTYFYHLL